MGKTNNHNQLNRQSRRSKFEIWSEILEICTQTSRTQSWLRRNLGLKTTTFKDAMNFLLARDLIRTVNEFEQIEYLTTEKGEQALFQYYSLITKFFTKGT
ncbi:MAG: winged helix-turn-helix domain-containing protein [Candidatus Hodarchaeota archaeon]